MGARRTSALALLFVTLLAASALPTTALASPYLDLTWTRVGTAPVLPSGPVGAWDHYGAIPGALVPVGGVHHMFYTGNDGTSWAIGHATSSDGLTWTKDPANPVLRNAQSPVVLHEDGLFKMWWVDPTTPSYSINYATSVNGTSWRQSPRNPVLTVSVSGWDSSLITTGAILHDGSGYRLWYTGTADHLTFAGGLATSPDGVNWTRFSKNPVLVPNQLGAWTSGFVTPCAVFSDGTTLVLWFVGGTAGSWHLGIAVSNNGTNWTAAGGPILSPEPSSWDSSQISRASVFVGGGRIWLYYTGMGDGTQQVGLAQASYPGPPLLGSASGEAGFFDTTTGYAVVVGIVIAGGIGAVAALGYAFRPARRGRR